MDNAFAFYYEDNIKLLSKFGKLIFFSPLKNELPDCDLYYFGGGYPELYPELEKFAKKFRKRCYDRLVFGECGGMMFLCRKINVGKRDIKMANLLDMDIVFTNKLQALGYVKCEVINKNPFFEGKLRGHEFHYSYAIADKDVKFAFKTDGKGIKDGYDGALVDNILGSYSHFHFSSAKLKILQ